MGPFFPKTNPEAKPSMVFVDGENLAIRYGHLLKSKGAAIPNHVRYEPDVYVWSNAMASMMYWAGVVRRHYYTSVQGDEPGILQVVEDLKAIGIESPNVFKKNKDK